MQSGPQISHRPPIRKRPPLPKHNDVNALLTGQKMELLDLRALVSLSNQSMNSLGKRPSLESPDIFVRRSVRSGNSFQRHPTNNTSIDTASQNIKQKLDSLLTVQEKFQQLKLTLQSKENANSQVCEQKCESSRISTSNSQRSLRRVKHKYFVKKEPVTGLLKAEAELRAKLSSKSWIVYDQYRNSILFERGSSVKREMASLTKIMTCIVTLDICEELDLDCTTFRVLVSRRAASVNGTSAELVVGTELTIRDLLYGLMLPSGNDAAMSLAQYIGTVLHLSKQSSFSHLPEDIYDPEKLAALRDQTKRCVNVFVAEMNRKAQELGMLRTHYSNPHGLSDKNNYSTCWDLARLCDHVTGHRHFMQIVTTKEFSCVCSRSLKSYRWTNTHKLLDEGWMGIKTGVTPAAGPCLSSFYKGSHNKHPIAFIVILLNCESMDARYIQTKLLLQYSLRQIQ